MLFADQGAEVIILKSKKESHSAKKLTGKQVVLEFMITILENKLPSFI